MMKRIYTLIIITTLFVFSASISLAFESSGTTYQLHASDIETGAGASTSTSFTSQEALGQTAPGFSSSTSFNDYSGILYWLFPGASGTPDIEQLHYRFRNDDGSETNATYLANTDTSANNLYTGDRVRLRIILSNNGTGPSYNYNYQLEYAPLSGTCATSSYTVVPTTTTTEPWQMGGESNVNDNTITTDSALLTNPGGKNFHTGRLRTTSGQTGVINITQSQFSEIEYSIKSNTHTTLNQEYCFRVTNIGNTTNFTYTIYPQISVSGITYRPQGGGGSPSIDSSETPSAPASGGGTGGGTISTQCSDGIDNDGDAGIDILDPHCHNNGNINNPYVPTWDNELVPSVPASGGGQGGSGGGDIGYLNNNGNPLLAQAFGGTEGADSVDLSKIINKALKFLIFPFFLMLRDR